MRGKDTCFGFSIHGTTDGWEVGGTRNTTYRNIVICKCKILKVNDVLHEINGINVKGMSQTEILKVIRECPNDRETKIVVQRRV